MGASGANGTFSPGDRGQAKSTAVAAGDLVPRPRCPIFKLGDLKNIVSCL